MLASWQHDFVFQNIFHQLMEIRHYVSLMQLLYHPNKKIGRLAREVALGRSGFFEGLLIHFLFLEILKKWRIKFTFPSYKSIS